LKTSHPRAQGGTPGEDGRERGRDTSPRGGTTTTDEDDRPGENGPPEHAVPDHLEGGDVTNLHPEEGQKSPEGKGADGREGATLAHSTTGGHRGAVPAGQLAGAGEGGLRRRLTALDGGRSLAI